MRSLLFFSMVLFAIGLIACINDREKTTNITLGNSSAADLEDQRVAIRRDSLPEAGTYPLLTNAAGDTIPVQLDDMDNDGAWDELFFVTDIKANGQDQYDLKWVDAPVRDDRRSHVRFGVRQTRETTVKPAISDTFYADQLPGVIGYQHYQTDGPTWENDKVGFRIYLDGRNSIDVFGKKVSYITSDSIGIGKDGFTENNYSEMKDWGMDILGVGNSVGIGGIALQIQDSLARLGVTEQDSLNNVDSTIFRVAADGPVRSLMEFDYRHWKPLDRDYRVKTTTSIWPGMYAFSNTVRLEGLTGDETLLVGLVNSNTSKALTEISINDQWVALLTHDQQSINKTWYMGLALLLPKENYLGYMEAPKQGRLSNSFFGKMKISNGQPVTYYAIAAWELSDPKFRDAAYFTEYVQKLGSQLSTVIKTKVN